MVKNCYILDSNEIYKDICLSPKKPLYVIMNEETLRLLERDLIDYKNSKSGKQVPLIYGVRIATCQDLETGEYEIIYAG